MKSCASFLYSQKIEGLTIWMIGRKIEMVCLQFKTNVICYTKQFNHDLNKVFVLILVSSLKVSLEFK
jgi:hypothetical protein